MPITAFDPTIHGFHFPNRFVNNVVSLPNGARIRTNGRCGGMAFASLDIFHAGRRAPLERFTDQPRGVPPDGTPIADYLYQRLMDSFMELSAVRFLAWTLLPDERTFIFKGVHGWSDDEVDGLRTEIDAGRPAALGLVGARRMSDVGRGNHQVVAYGYEPVAGGFDLFVYDNNTPDVRTTLQWRRNRPGLVATNRSSPWRGLFVHTYQAEPPPDAIWH
jgi:hypothetical protein